MSASNESLTNRQAERNAGNPEGIIRAPLKFCIRRGGASRISAAAPPRAGWQVFSERFLRTAKSKSRF